MSVVVSILIMILILSLLTVVHEWGHFIAARIFKVKVNEFSIFMGPKLFQRRMKKTGMLFSIRALPFGGYCALEGEIGEDEEKSGDGGEKSEASDNGTGEIAKVESDGAADGKTGGDPVNQKDSGGDFYKKPWYIRACILVAGVTMNYLLAVLIVAIIFASNGYDTRKVSAVSNDAPMTIAGLEAGDTVTAYNGLSITTPVDYSLYSYVAQPETTSFTVKKKDGSKVKYEFKRAFNVDENKGSDREENPGTITADIDVYICSGKGYKTRTFAGTYHAYWDNNRALTVSLTYAGGEKIEYYYGEKDGVKGLYITEWDNYETDPAGRTTRQTDLHNPSEDSGIDKLTDEEYVDAMIEYFNANQMYARYGFNYTYSVRGNFFSVIGNSILYVHSLIKSVFMSLWFLITGKLGLGALSGPIGITNIVNQVVTVSAPVSGKLLALLEMTALISANLAVINLLPIPGLDGGKLLFIVIELCRGGKKVSPKVESIISMIFFGLLILLAIIIAGNDIVNIFKGNQLVG